jgi:diketogulonate reductase-like aldo/keto reductase
VSSSITKRAIPSSGEMMPVIGLGTWQTFDVRNEADKDPLREVLQKLRENGGSVVDSSPMYGLSEQVVGQLSDELALNKSLFLATKVWTSGKENGIRQMNESLKLLRRKTLDLIQIHNLTDWETHLPTLREWKGQGRIRYLGITHYTESAYAAIEKILLNHAIDFLQINYSLSSRKAEERLLPLAVERGVAVIINRPFEEGALFRKFNGTVLPAWSSDYGITSWGQLFLKFVLSHPAVTCVIPGTAKPHHLIDNMQAGRGQYPDETVRRKMIDLLKE